MSKLHTSNEKIDSLVDLIQSQIETEPFEYDGQLWMDWAQPAVADYLKIPVRTLTRMISRSQELVARAPKIDGRKRWLLRTGPDTKTQRDIANIMSAMWAKELKRQAIIYETEPRGTSRAEFGMINGCIEVWPEGKALEIFKLVLADWTAFMARAKPYFTDEYRNEKGDPTRYYRRPTMKVLRRFAPVAPDMLITQEQGSGIQAAWHLAWYAKFDQWEKVCLLKVA